MSATQTELPKGFSEIHGCLVPSGSENKIKKIEEVPSDILGRDSILQRIQGESENITLMPTAFGFLLHCEVGRSMQFVWRDSEKMRTTSPVMEIIDGSIGRYKMYVIKTESGATYKYTANE